MDHVLFQGLLETEDVALAFSTGWTRPDSSRGSSHRDEGQESPGGLTSLGKTVSFLPNPRSAPSSPSLFLYQNPHPGVHGTVVTAFLRGRASLTTSGHLVFFNVYF